MKRWVVLLVAAVIGASGALAASAQSGKQPPIIIWTEFNDQNPRNAPDKWLAAALKEYTGATGNQVTNIYQPHDQMSSRLNVAVQSKDSVPDVSYVDTRQIRFYAQYGTLMDLTDFVKQAPWFKDISPTALTNCTAPDGRILCVPTSTASTLIYYWKDLYPGGFPATTDALLVAAKDLRAKNKFALTMKASGRSFVETTYFSLIVSFGGRIADKDGKAAWASPETEAALKFARELFANRYAPEAALTAGFDGEGLFSRGDAAGFLAGSWSYVSLKSLTAPDGSKFDKGAGSVQAAFDEGKLGFAPPLAAPKGKPAAFTTITGWAIPVGAAHPEAAKAFIDFQMTTTHIADFAIAYGALPAMHSAFADKAFQTFYWKTVAQYQRDYGQPPPGLIDYDRGMALLGDAINSLMSDPSRDIRKELQAAQEKYNAALN